MSYLESIPVDAGVDLSGSQYKAIQIDGTLATNNSDVAGILQNKPENGEDAGLGILGRTRYVAGGAVTKGNRLQVQSGGWLTAVASNQFGIGTALNTISSGGVGEVFLNNIGAPTTVVSAHLT